MTANKIDLLIKEIDPTTHNGRYLRENLRRIKDFLDNLDAAAFAFPSPSIFNSTDQFDVLADGQTVFTLTAAPIKPSISVMLINGVEQTYGAQYTIINNVLTFDPVTAGFNLELSNEFGQPDHIIVHYMT